MSTMAVGDLIQRWAPGSYDADWTWEQEKDDLIDHDMDRLSEMVVDILLGEGIRRPVVLGADGRVWDGHHRIVAAMIAGLSSMVPVMHSEPYD